MTRVPEDRFFSLRPVWRNGIKVLVSSPSRTAADILDRPGLGGGMKHAAEIIQGYFGGEHRDDEDLRSCLERLSNRTAMKRLGFILETLDIEAPKLVAFCLENVSAGYSRLDPAVRRRGTLVRRWNLDEPWARGSRPMIQHAEIRNLVTEGVRQKHDCRQVAFVLGGSLGYMLPDQSGDACMLPTQCIVSIMDLE